MQSFKCSIIVPVFNVEKYLRQCVDSLVNQTHSDLEIILVDDGSPDRSGIICDEYAAMDDRVKVIHKKNGGVAAARKDGIELSSGDYIMSLDGDDWLELDTLECCVNEFKKNSKVGCVLFPYIREYAGFSSEVHFYNGNQIFIDGEAKSRVYRKLFGLLGEELNSPEKADVLVSCCMKLYRADLAKQGRWYDIKEIGSSEDALFNMFALHNCNSYVYLDKCFYHYRKIEGTITSTYRPNLIQQWGRLFDIIEGIIQEKGLGNDYREALQNRIALSSIGIGMNIICNRQESFYIKKSKIGNYLRSIRYKTAIQQLDFSSLPLKWKLFLWCCKKKWSFGASIMLVIMQSIKNRNIRRI